ncbi:hypothetical protein [Clostridium sp. JNZ J1-5]
MKKRYASVILFVALFAFTVSLYGCKSKPKENLNQNQQSKNVTDMSANKSNDKTAKESPATAKDEKKEGSLDSSKNSKAANTSGNNAHNPVETIKKTKKDLKGDKVGIFVKDATVGSMAKVIIDDTKIDKNKAIFYQVYSKGKPISKTSEIKLETTMYPVAEVGSKVQIKLYDKDKKEKYSLDVTVKSGE